MQLFRGPSGLLRLQHQVNKQALMVTIGNFDGVHRGHQLLIERIKERAQQDSGISVVMFVEPHARETFKPETAPPRVLPWYEKVRCLDECGVDAAVMFPFRSIRHLPAEVFVREQLGRANIRYLTVGKDFRFGEGREGDFNTLQTLAREYDIEVTCTPNLNHEGRRISSTWLREALVQGDFTMAEALLGQPYKLVGKVVPGQRLAHKMGYPTANLNIKFRKSCLHGVYAVRVNVPSQPEPLDGIANIGTRPTTLGGPSFEVHLFDYAADLYGQRIAVTLQQFLRPEKKFPSLDKLAEQIAQDCELSRKVLNSVE